MTNIIPTATEEYPLIIRVPAIDQDLWTAIVQNEEKIRALFEGKFFKMEYGKATVSLHDNVVVTVSLDERTYQRQSKVIPILVVDAKK